MMILRPDSKELHQQPDFSLTRLLVATLYYVHKHFTQGMTMAELQSKYIVQPKSLALCVTGRKYQGGMDRKVQIRKRCKSAGGKRDGQEPLQWQIQDFLVGGANSQGGYILKNLYVKTK